MDGLFGQSMASAGLGGLVGGLFGHSGNPYKHAARIYQDYANRAQAMEQPFYNAGTAAIPEYQSWLHGMQNPSGFINNLMNQYQQSPYAAYEQQQAMRAAQNAGSATGLTGSTPLLKQMQQNAANISSQDMNQWLGNVLGINTMYGQGEQNLMAGGHQAGNSLASLLTNQGNNMAEMRYGRDVGRQNDLFNMIGGAASLASLFL